MNRIDEVEINQRILLGNRGDQLYEQEKLSTPTMDLGLTMSDAAVQRMIFDLPTGDGEGDESDAPSDSNMTFAEDSGIATKPSDPESEEDSPASLIRRDNRALLLTRAIVLLVTLLVGAFSVAFVFKYTSSYEDAHFHSEFDDIATRVIDSFLLDTRMKFIMARNTAALVTDLLNVGPTNHVNATFSDASFDDITRVQQLVSFPLAVSWSPFLTTLEERAVCEQAVSTERGQQVEMFHIKNGVKDRDDSSPPYHPITQRSTLIELRSSIMFNQMSDPIRSQTLQQMLEGRLPVMSPQFYRTGPYYDQYTGNANTPGAIIFYPVFERGDRKNGKIVGSIATEFDWRDYTKSSVYPPHSELLSIVVENSCGQVFTYRLIDQDLVIQGAGYLLDATYNGFGQSSTYHDYEDVVRLALPSTATSLTATHEAVYCRYRFSVYPTAELQAEYKSGKPAVYAWITVGIFVIVAVLFVIYDCIVRRRQHKVMMSARKNGAIVSSLFPASVRERLYMEADAPQNKSSSSEAFAPHKLSKSSYLSNVPVKKPKKVDPTADSTQKCSSEPIAELFDNTTIMFLDIAGFTAWASYREPRQVFQLLETLYGAFDEVATRLGVFKIETIGDCYVAVTGLPEPNRDHAVVMVKFAHLCLRKMEKLTKELEVQLGPGTADLLGRAGLHSGSVTGGVLRGEKARFQLFGDAMNTASRMESTGTAGRIHVSMATADLLIAAGREDWIIPRVGLVSVKGKGEMQTFWVEPSKRRSSARDNNSQPMSSAESDVSIQDMESDLGVNNKLTQSMRLIEWNVDLLYGYLQKLVVRRAASKSKGRPRLNSANSFASIGSLAEDEGTIMRTGGIVIDEFAEVIEMPRYDSRAARKLSLSEDAKFDEVVYAQLKEYVMRIASMYRATPFHNFEHAAHVTMSTNKLLGRIIRPRYAETSNGGSKSLVDQSRELYFASCGISGDAMMAFAIVLASLIHDVDHCGLKNAQLSKLKTPSAIIYKNKSITEQHSMDVAWKVLMDEDFEQLRACIYTNKFELRRFRQLLVNAVIATDIEDAQFQLNRKIRWDKAFGSDGLPTDELRRSSHRGDVKIDRKATLVYESIIQAADIAHTMQHWQTYTKFNERLFEEQYVAHLNGHEEKDPAEHWYESELTFFDQHVLPLADQLKTCGVFGGTSLSVSGGCGDEFIGWAKQNRQEWEKHGQSLVKQMHDACVAKYLKEHVKFRRGRSNGSISHISY